MIHEAKAVLLASSVAILAISSEPELQVVDGDTIKVDGTTYRLLGYDTPETRFAKCDAERRLGDLARLRLQGILSDYSWRIEPVETKDKYGRVLAHLYVDVEEDVLELDVSEILIGEGYARPYDGGRRASWCKPQVKRLSP